MPVALSDFIKAHKLPVSAKTLHLVHCRTAKESLDLLTKRTLTPSLCDVYGVDLLYLFYGRPAYKPAQGESASGIIDLAPVCLVIDPEVLKTAVRILPFDSGGFPRYRDVLGPDFDMSEFELGTRADAPLRLVSAFYQTNANYYEQRPTLSESTLSFGNLAPRAYARLIADQAMRDVDDRCGTIEVQFDTAISLKTALRAIVAPAEVLSDPEVEAALLDCPSAVPLPYKTYGRYEPMSLTHAIYQKVEDFLTSQGGLP